MTGFESFIYTLGALTFSVGGAFALLYPIWLLERPRRKK